MSATLKWWSARLGNTLVASGSSRTIIRHTMKPLMSLILILSVLVASMMPTYVHAEPVKTDAAPTPAHPGVPVAPPTEVPNDNSGPNREDQSDDKQDSTTTAPPPVGLTPRTDSIEALARSLRTPSESKASVRLELSLSWRVRTHRKPARLDQLLSRARCVSTALRFVASCLRSHAPPVA